MDVMAPYSFVPMTNEDLERHFGIVFQSEQSANSDESIAFVPRDGDSCVDSMPNTPPPPPRMGPAVEMYADDDNDHHQSCGASWSFWRHVGQCVRLLRRPIIAFM